MTIIVARAGNLLLPVLDITDPDFAVPSTEAEMKALEHAFHRDEARRHAVPTFIMRWMLRAAARKSRLVRALFASDAGYLDAISTYLMKLGPEHLPPGYDTPMDRRFASSPHIPLLRLRMAQVARLLAGVLRPALEAEPARPLALINIAGGPALDSLNALILLARENASLLQRPTQVLVLDLEADGPAFGANALAALKADGAPLAGLPITFAHHAYDWNDRTALRDVVARLEAEGALAVLSSEGGLFEYGSDAAIIGTLEALLPFPRTILAIAGSVTRNDETRKRMVANSRLKIVPRGLEGFLPLAGEAGWTLAACEPGLLSDQVLLRRS